MPTKKANTVIKSEVTEDVVKKNTKVVKDVVKVVVKDDTKDVTKDDTKDVSEVNNLTELTNSINQFAVFLKTIQAKLKIVVKDYEKQQKHIDKEKAKKDKARKTPSGFAKPNKISDELCDFMGIAHGTETSRTEVTKFITGYVKTNNLYNMENRRFLKPDAKLKKILCLKEGDEASFFNLQRLISSHFPKPKSQLIAEALSAMEERNKV